MLDRSVRSRRRGRRLLPAVLTLASLATLTPALVAGAGSRSVPRPSIAAASGPVHTVPVGGALPSDSTCAGRVVPTAENRPENNTPNHTRGTAPNSENPRVTGNFVGTTDEIIQWAACKWGMDVQWARNQAALESFWYMSTVGDNGESFGLLQVRRPYHASAFADENAVRSTAYNADYAWSVWRRCFEGEYTWLNDVERGRDYAAGDGLGCMGLWFAGRWYTDAAVGYMNRVSGAGAAIPTPAPGPPSSTTTSTSTTSTVPRTTSTTSTTSTTVPRTTSTTSTTSTTVPRTTSTTVPRTTSTTVAPTTSTTPPTTTPPATTTPSNPRQLTATTGSRVVDLAWRAPQSNGGLPITDYRIERSSDGGRTWTTLNDGVSVNRQFRVTGLTNGSSYQFRVSARNAAGWGRPSGVVTSQPHA